MLKENNRKRVLLIDPKGFGAGLNLGLGYLAAVLIKEKNQVKVIDCNNDSQRLSEGVKIRLLSPKKEDWRIKINKGLKWQPDVIGISINSFSLEHAIEVISYCRSKVDKKVKFIAGGPHITMVKEEFMDNYHEFFDYAVIGEGEETMADLLKNINKPSRVKGILYFDKNKKISIKTAERLLIDNLDKIPPPAFDVFDSIDRSKGLSNYQMISSRGCPYKCVFCFHMWTNRWRARSPGNIIAEIKMAIRKYHIKSITFWDDNFTLDIKRAKKICDLMVIEKINLKYALAGLRADRIDEEMIKKLKESGCIGISMGIEDADPVTSPFVQKGESLEQIKKAVILIKKYNIPLLTYMVTGLVKSSYSSFLKSLKFVEDLGVNAHWSIAFPFPNTPLYEWAKKEGRFLMSVDQGFRYSMTNKNPPVVFDTKKYPKEERLRAYYIGNLRCKSYDMLVESRDSNVFKQTSQILSMILRYDRKRTFWHLKNITKMLISL